MYIVEQGWQFLLSSLNPKLEIRLPESSKQKQNSEPKAQTQNIRIKKGPLIHVTMEKLDVLFRLLDQATNLCSGDALAKEAKSFYAARSNSETQMATADDGTPVYAVAPLLTKFFPILCHALVGHLNVDKPRTNPLTIKAFVILIKNLLQNLDQLHDSYRWQGPDFIFGQGNKVPNHMICTHLHP